MELVESATARFTRLSRLARGSWLTQPDVTRQEIEALQGQLATLDDDQVQLERVGGSATNHTLSAARAEFSQRLARIEGLADVGTLELQLERWKLMTMFIGGEPSTRPWWQGDVQDPLTRTTLSIVATCALLLAIATGWIAFGLFVFTIPSLPFGRTKWALYDTELVIKRGKRVRRIPLWSIAAKSLKSGQAVEVRGLWNVVIRGTFVQMKRFMELLPSDAVRDRLESARRQYPADPLITVLAAHPRNADADTFALRDHVLASVAHAYFVPSSASSAVAAALLELQEHQVTGSAILHLGGMPASLLPRIANVPGVVRLNDAATRSVMNGDTNSIHVGDSVFNLWRI